MGGSIRNSCSPTFESININLLHTRDNNLGKAYVVLPSKLYFLVHIHLRSMQPPMLDAVGPRTCNINDTLHCTHYPESSERESYFAQKAIVPTVPF